MVLFNGVSTFFSCQSGQELTLFFKNGHELTGLAIFGYNMQKGKNTVLFIYAPLWGGLGVW